MHRPLTLGKEAYKECFNCHTQQPTTAADATSSNGLDIGWPGSRRAPWKPHQVSPCMSSSLGISGNFHHGGHSWVAYSHLITRDGGHSGGNPAQQIARYGEKLSALPQRSNSRGGSSQSLGIASGRGEGLRESVGFEG